MASGALYRVIRLNRAGMNDRFNMRMKHYRTTLLSFLAAAIAATIIVALLWNDYVQERRAHEQVLIVRGNTLLSALEGGLRSHRRVGWWFASNLDAILEDTAAAAGITGLYLTDEQGRIMAASGDVPLPVQPSITPQWTPQGLVLGRRIHLIMPGSEGGLRQGLQRGRGREGSEFPQQDIAADMHPESDIAPVQVWLMVLLDTSDYAAAIGKAGMRLTASLILTLIAVLLALGIWMLIQRQALLASELTLSWEREKRLEERALLGAGLAHETKNPLSIIRGLAQSWKNQSKGSAEEQKAAEKIMDEADRVVGRINAFLQYARPISPDLQPVQLDAVVSQTTELFKDEASIKNILLKTQTQPIEGLADADLLRQVIVNLLANALVACREGDSITTLLSCDSGSSITLCIRDTGEGIVSEDLPRIIQPYFTRRKGGVGLGLAIVDQIVHAHGWRMKIDSTPGEGTTVTLSGIREASSR